MKNILIITGGSNGLGKAIVEYSLNKDLLVCNLDREKSIIIININYKEFIGDISDEQFVNQLLKKFLN